LPPDPPDDPAVPADPLPELLDEHPAAAIDAATIAPQAASHRVLVSFIAEASIHLGPAISRERLFSTPLRESLGEA
jgi:hypothetical protein